MDVVERDGALMGVHSITEIITDCKETGAKMDGLTDGIQGNIGTILGWKAGFIWLGLQVFSLFYAWWVYKYLPKNKIRYNTSYLVAGGTLVTIIAHGLIVGWNNVIYGYESIIALAASFVIAGWPMIAGYSLRESKLQADAEARAKAKLEKTRKQFVQLNHVDTRSEDE